MPHASCTITHELQQTAAAQYAESALAAEDPNAAPLTAGERRELASVKAAAKTDPAPGK
jgi:hypothetical protein